MPRGFYDAPMFGVQTLKPPGWELALAARRATAWSCLVACLGPAGLWAQPAGAEGHAIPRECGAFLGHWAGQWSQGFYGTQYIDVTHVSPQCIATVEYRPTEAPASTSYQVAIRDGAMEFGCNVPGSTCRIEVQDGTLRFTYRETSGFVNIGTFFRN